MRTAPNTFPHLIDETPAHLLRAQRCAEMTAAIVGLAQACGSVTVEDLRLLGFSRHELDTLGDEAAAAAVVQVCTQFFQTPMDYGANAMTETPSTTPETARTDLLARVITERVASNGCVTKDELLAHGFTEDEITRLAWRDRVRAAWTAGGEI